MRTTTSKRILVIATLLATGVITACTGQPQPHATPTSTPTATSTQHPIRRTPVIQPSESPTKTPDPTSTPTRTEPPVPHTLSSSYTTYFPYAEYRNTNQTRAAQLINGTVIQPGAEFSLNGIVGERTEANGFVPGFIIKDGIFVTEMGGGVSQVATTTFNAAFWAGMSIVERHNHSLYIDRYPVGLDATVAWGQWDMRWQNTLPVPVHVHAWVIKSTPTTQGQMHVRLTAEHAKPQVRVEVGQPYDLVEESTRWITAKDCEPNEGWPGFSVDVKRWVNGDLTDAFTTHYVPADRVVCGPPPSPASDARTPGQSPTPQQPRR